MAQSALLAACLSAKVLFTVGFCIDFNLLIHQVDNPQFWNTVRRRIRLGYGAGHDASPW